ncbi:hypothetical protein LFAB_03695 [Lactiplantibacillus fabifermentans T30PCM01]|uniref:Uncharacterized protein n=2 Tax=Lactiplantibacillus fabifermentans TaxID=483011 RepID=A0A0R2P2D9_9LACO|nr:hypothetical protein LFAB_03695 [Lactiplantibacillus fabifermentans T30PCM01]KRO28954.1 hypothetical protein DY78_GL001806 [Lactiplantibacillus fabifermentans DSM 21115]
MRALFLLLAVGQLQQRCGATLVSPSAVSPGGLVPVIAQPSPNTTQVLSGRTTPAKNFDTASLQLTDR